MRRHLPRAGISGMLGGLLLVGTVLPGFAQGTPPAPEAAPGAAAAESPPAGAPSGTAQPPTTTGAAPAPAASGAAPPPAGEPDISFTATLRIAELRFNEPPQASITVVVQPNGQRLVDLQLQNLPGGPQAGTTYRDVGVQLTITGALADLVNGGAAAAPPAGAGTALPAGAGAVPPTGTAPPAGAGAVPPAGTAPAATPTPAAAP